MPNKAINQCLNNGGKDIEGGGKPQLPVLFSVNAMPSLIG